MSNIYLLENKNQLSILNSLKKFCDIYGNPEQFGSDNGREFINKSIEEFLNIRNIKFIHGAPYSPHSQGVAERTHITIRKALITKFLKKF